MGMDVIGVNPTSEKGEYFRNTVWYWHPLWDYCLNLHEEIAGKVEYGHSNDGDGLNGYDSHTLGERLLADIENGITAEYEQRYNEYLASLPFDDCRYCGTTGIRTDEVGVEHGMPTKELDAELAVALGRTHGYCNACNGEGRTIPWNSNYPFSVDNVREFAEFLLECGGFEIH